MTVKVWLAAWPPRVFTVGVMSIAVLSSVATITKAVVSLFHTCGLWPGRDCSQHWMTYSSPRLSTGSTNEASNDTWAMLVQ